MVRRSETDESVPKRSLRKKSFINDDLPLHVETDLVNDDEAERREVEERRRQREAEESASRASKKRPSIFHLIAEYQNLTPSERAAHYQKCLQMSSENKINTQNAFSLLLIDQMAHMMKEKSQMDNFQVAGCTLDASSKIYACRVDVVHSEAMRIARGFDKHSKRKLEVDENADNSDDGQNNEKDGSPVKAKKIKKRSVLTDKNSQALIAEPDGNGYSAHQKDTIFEEMTTSAEASEPGNCHFLSSLKVQDSVCKLMLQSELPFPLATQDRTTFCFPDEICGVCEDFSVLTDVFICPTLRRHSQNDTSTLEPRNVEEGLEALTALEENDEIFDIDYEECEPMDDEENNENESDKVLGFDDVYGNYNDTMDTVAPPTACRKVPKPETIVDVANTVSVTALEYSFFNQKAVNLLGGPDRWKIGSFSTTQTSRNPTKRKRKEIAILTFTESAFSDINNTPSKNRKNKFTLANRTLQTWSREKLLMVADLFESTCLISLYTLPRSKCKTASFRRRENKDGTESNKYSGDNGSMDMDFGSDVDFSEDHNANDEQVDYGYKPSVLEDDVASIVTYRKEHVSNTSIRVPPVETISNFLPYALKAKKIDMKQLKAGVFDILTDTVQNKENGNDNQRYLKFSQLYALLPSKLEQMMQENLTPHLAFMALLHLANEKNLLIQDQKDLADLKIMFECV